MTNLRSLSDLFRAAMKLAAACAFAAAMAVGAVGQTQTNEFPLSGNAGVGTTTPTLQSGTTNTMIEVKGTVNPGVGLTSTAAGGRQYFVYSSQANPGYFSVFDATAGADRFVIGSSGNIGIGTTSPAGLLHVSGVGGGAWSYFAGNVNGVGGPNGGVDGLAIGWNRSGWHGESTIAYKNSTGAYPRLAFSSFSSSGGYTEEMTLRGGSLGIGTTSPSARLHLDGGSFRLAQTPGETPFQLYSYSNSDSLWLTSGNPQKSEIHLSPGYAVDYDRSVTLQYSPGATGAASGTLNIGQILKNNAAWTHGTTAFFTSGTERMRINSGGNVGIGTATPNSAYKLDVNGEINATGIRINGTPISTGGSSQWANGTNSIFYNTGDVGIGTANPTDRLTVYKGDNNAYLRIGAPFLYQSAIGFSDDTNGQDSVIYRPGSTRDLAFYTTTAGNVMYLTQGGTVGIATSSPNSQYKLDVNGNANVTGNINVTGSINAKYQDLAEWVPSSEQLSAGTVVVLDTTKSNQVVSSNAAYDTRVAGVISAQPGITLGESGEGKVLVATTGRVRVKVDASRGAIQIGDLLVTSDVSGVAMKSEPVDLAGRKMHMPGTIIGKALEPLAKGSGEILVLLSLQ